jgi:histidine triad (HIT) family protein
MAYDYDSENIFAKILRGEIPCTKVAETAHSLAFKDINPAAPTHILVIPKGAYVNYDHFATAATDEEIIDFNRTLAKITHEAGVAQAAGGEGYRLITNAGAHGVQDVPHFHMHILGGRPLGRMISA